MIFDSQVPVGRPQAFYLRAEAAPVSEAELDAGIALFSRCSERQGLRAWTREEVEPPAPLRLYRAAVSEHSILVPGDERVVVQL